MARVLCEEKERGEKMMLCTVLDLFSTLFPLTQEKQGGNFLLPGNNIMSRSPNFSPALPSAEKRLQYEKHGNKHFITIKIACRKTWWKKKKKKKQLTVLSQNSTHSYLYCRKIDHSQVLEKTNHSFSVSFSSIYLFMTYDKYILKRYKVEQLLAPYPNISKACQDPGRRC